MALSFRPIREDWGDHSSCFITRDRLITVLEAIADHTIEADFQGRYFELSEDAGGTVAWILRGESFLHFLERPEFTKQWLFDAIEANDITLEDIASLVHNMQALASSWRSMLDGDGSLSFRID